MGDRATAAFFDPAKEGAAHSVAASFEYSVTPAAADSHEASPRFTHGILTVCGVFPGQHMPVLTRLEAQRASFEACWDSSYVTHYLDTHPRHRANLHKVVAAGSWASYAVVFLALAAAGSQRSRPTLPRRGVRHRFPVVGGRPDHRPRPTLPRRVVSHRCHDIGTATDHRISDYGGRGSMFDGMSRCGRNRG
jgi:hypothetical protein